LSITFNKANNRRYNRNYGKEDMEDPVDLYMHDPIKYIGIDRILRMRDNGNRNDFNYESDYNKSCPYQIACRKQFFKLEVLFGEEVENVNI
jgi:hypothetical protein